MIINTPILTLIKSCFLAVIFLFGGWNILSQIFYSLIPFGILLACLLCGLVYCLRAPPASPETVEAIIGKELHLAANGDYVMKTVAHRGAGLDVPENTLEAFKMCSDLGCDAIEFDVTLTKDGVPIVFHDTTLERLADKNLVVNEQKWDDIKDINLSVKHPYRDRYPKTHIPTLEQAVTQMLNAGQRMFIDIKDNDTKMVPVILNLFDKHPELISRACVTTFFPNILYLIRRKNPKIVGCMAWRPHSFAYESYKYPDGKGPKRYTSIYKHYIAVLCDFLLAWGLPRVLYYFCGLSIILLLKESLHAQAIMEWRQKGVRVMAWTVNSPMEKQHLARNLKITYLTDTLTGENTTHNY